MQKLPLKLWQKFFKATNSKPVKWIRIQWQPFSCKHCTEFRYFSARDGSCWKFFQNSIWFVYLYHHSFARDNPGQHLASCNFFCFQHPSRRNCAPQLEFAGHFPAFPVSISASIVFAFTLTQYIVVASPLKYGRMITKKKAFVSVVAVYLYHTFICCLPLMGVPRKTKDAIDLFFHDYAVVLITIEVYVILHYTMKKKMATGRSLQNETSSTSREERRHIKVQRSFARLNVVFFSLWSCYLCLRLYLWQ